MQAYRDARCSGQPALTRRLRACWYRNAAAARHDRGDRAGARAGRDPRSLPKRRRRRAGPSSPTTSSCSRASRATRTFGCATSRRRERCHQQPAQSRSDDPPPHARPARHPDRHGRRRAHPLRLRRPSS